MNQPEEPEVPVPPRLPPSHSAETRIPEAWQPEPGAAPAQPVAKPGLHWFVKVLIGIGAVVGGVSLIAALYVLVILGSCMLGR